MKDLYTLREAAEQLSLSERTLRNLHAQGKIAFTRISKKAVRISRTEIESFVDSLETF